MNGPGGEELLDLINDAEESLNFNDLRNAYDLSNPDERQEFNDIRNQILNQAREDGVEGLGVVVSDLSPEEQEAYHQEVTINRFNDTFGMSSEEQYNYLREKGLSDDDIEAITNENDAKLDEMLDLVLEANTLGTDAQIDAGSLGVSLELEPGTTNTTAGLQLLYEQGRIPEEYLPFLPSIVNSVEQTVQAQSNVNYATSVSDDVSDQVIADLFDETGVTNFDENIFGDFKEENQWDESMFTTANGRADGISSNIQLEMTNIEANPTAENVEASLTRIQALYSNYNTDEDNAMLDSFVATLGNLNSNLVDIEATADNNNQLTLAEDGFNALSDIYDNDVRGGIIRQATSNVFAGEFGDTENQAFIEEREQELAAIGYLASIPDDERTDEQQQQMDILLTAITGVDMNSGIDTGLGYTSELNQRNEIYTEVTKDNTKNVIALGAAVVGTVGGGILGTTVAPITGGSSVAGGAVAGSIIGVGVGASLLGIDDITGSDYTAEEYLEVSLRSGVQGGFGGGSAAFGNVALGSAPGFFRTVGVGVGENVVSGNVMNASDTFITSGGDFGETFDDITTINSIDVATGFSPAGGTFIGRIGRNGENLTPVVDDVLEIADVPPVTGNGFTAEFVDTSDPNFLIRNEHMEAMGLTPDTPVYRVVDPQYIDLETMTIAGNPDSMALIEDIYSGQMMPNPMAPGILPDVPMRIDANTLNDPSLNVALSPNGIKGYNSGDLVMVEIRLGDVLDQGGLVYPDRGAAIGDAILVTVPESVPFRLVNDPANTTPSVDNDMTFNFGANANGNTTPDNDINVDTEIDFGFGTGADGTGIPSDGSVIDPDMALSLYAGSTYSDINNALRNNLPLTDHQDAIVDALHLRASDVLVEDIVLYRGVPHDFRQGLVKMPDGTYVDNAFTSTTTDSNVASQQFAFQQGDPALWNGYVMEINVPAGTAGINNTNSFESEFILPPGTRLQVDSIDETTNVVRMSVVSNDVN